MESSGQRPQWRRLGSAARRASRLAEVSLGRFLEDRCPQFAAAIAYFGLFSLFPLAIVFTAVFGLLSADAATQDRVVDFILEELPLSEGSGEGQVRRLLEGISGNAEAIGLLGLAGVVYSASALMAAIRNSLNAVWDLEQPRGALKAKALDLLLVAALAALVGLSLAATVLQRLVLRAGSKLDVDGAVLGAGLDLIGLLAPILLSAAAFAVLFRVIPTSVRSLREVWPGILVATLGYELAKRGFSVYLENFASYNAVYGSLGAVIAVLVFVYVAAMVFLAGAEHAAAWPEVRDEDLEEPTFLERLPRRAWARLRLLAPGGD